MTDTWIMSLFDDEPEVYGPKERQRKDGERSGTGPKHRTAGEGDGHIWWERTLINHPLGAPPLDWWNVSEEEVRRRLILSMCPERVCRTCGEPSRRIVEQGYVADNSGGKAGIHRDGKEPDGNQRGIHRPDSPRLAVANKTVGFSDCGHDDWRPGSVLVFE